MLVGFPIRQFQMCKGTNQETCIWVDENAVPSYEKEGYTFTGAKQMAYCPPAWIADKTSGGILLLDDWTRADPRFIQACMELIDRQEYISWKLPKDWHIILTSNPDNGEYTVNSIDQAQKTRYISVEMKFNAKEWAKWAETEGIDGRCINFMLMYGQEIVEKNTKANPRSLVTFFNAISGITNFEANLPLIRMIGDGSVGSEVSGMFTAFIDQRLDKLVTPDFIINTKSFKEVAEAVQECVGRPKETGYKPAVASVITTRLINYSLNFAKNNPVKDSYIDRITEIVEKDLFGVDLCFNFVKQVYAGSDKFKKLSASAKVAKIVMN